MEGNRLMEYVGRYRVYLSFIGFLTILITLIIFRDIGSQYYLVRMDYIVWFTAIVVTLCTVTDLKLYCSGEGFPLTLMIEMLGFVVVVVARAASAIHSLFIIPDNLYIGGLIANYFILAYTVPLMVIGSFMNMGAVVLRRVYSESKDVLIKGLSCQDFLSHLNKFFGKILKHPIVLAFLIGFMVRLIPEIHWWPYPIGYDTVEYIAHLRDYVVSPAVFRSYFWFGGMRNIPPLLDMVLYPFAKIVDPWYIFKLYPPAIYGLLIALIALFSRNILKLGNKLVTVIALAASYNLLLLRMSWDLHKQFLGTVLFLAAVMVLEKGDSLKNHVAAITLLLLSSLATELGAGLTVILSMMVVVKNISRFFEGRSWRSSASIATYTVLAFVAYLLILWYTMWPAIVAHPVTGISLPGVGASLAQQSSVFAYIVVTYGSITPLLLIGIDTYRKRLRYSIYMLAVLLVLATAPWLAPYTMVTAIEWDRILMIATVFALPIALSQLKILRRRTLIAIYILFLILPGFYATMSTGFYRYNEVLVGSLYRMPPGLIPAPSPSEIFEVLLDIAKHIKNLDFDKAPMIALEPYARIIHLEIRNPDPSKLVYLRQDPAIHVVCEIMYRVNRTGVYILSPYILPEVFNQTINTSLMNIENKSISCGPYGIAEISMAAKLVYHNDLAAIFYIEIRKINENSIHTTPKP